MTTNGTNGAAPAAPLVARVAAANDKGIRVEGRDGWLNFSKFATGIVAPDRGELVAITLDKSGFVRRVEAVPQDAAQAVQEGQETASLPSKDILIIASRPDLKSADLLALAERLEAWVTR